ncbi:hypothetical protein [Ekhidna sp.]
MLVKILTSIGSIASIIFGIWHFFAPQIWDWYSYIYKTATELIVAVRAINIFFSLSLLLLGVANLLFVFRIIQDQFSLGVMLGISTILWSMRVVLQIIYPQGSQNPTVQYSMLAIFILVALCYGTSLVVVFNESYN